MTEEFLDDAQVGSSFKKMGCKAMTKSVRGDVGAVTCLCTKLSKDLRTAKPCHWIPVTGQENKILRARRERNRLALI